MLTSSPMKLSLTLDNDEKVLINWGVIFESADSNDTRTTYCGSVAYTYQLPLTHKLFEYYRKVDTSSKYHEVVEELYKRKVSYISIHVHQTIDLNEDAFESLNKCGYVHSTFMKKSLIGSPVVVSHTLVDGAIMDNCETFNKALQDMYEHYVELQLFRDLEPEYNEETFVDIIKAEKIKESFGMKETRKIEIELSNKTRQTAECTISKFCEESPRATVRIRYSYQLPVTHSIFEYYKNTYHNEYRHVIDEILERGAKAIIVHKLDILTNVNVYALESTLTNGQFLSKFELDLNDSNFMQVGYITNDGVEHVEPTVLNAGLEYIINRYALSVYNDIIPMSRFEQSDYYTRKIRLVKE